jgi:hypothetical protein
MSFNWQVVMHPEMITVKIMPVKMKPSFNFTILGFIRRHKLVVKNKLALLSYNNLTTHWKGKKNVCTRHGWERALSKKYRDSKNTSEQLIYRD